MRSNRLLVFILLSVGIGAGLWNCGLARAGGRPVLDDYSTLSPEARKRLVRQYVFQNNQGYWEVRNFRYLVRTKVSAEYAMKTAIQMDRFYASFSKLFGARLTDHVKSEIYVLADAQEYRQFLAPHGIEAGGSRGMFVPPLNALITYYQKDEDDTQRTLFHEGTHQILHAYAVGKELPPRLDEGLAENFESWDPSRTYLENIRISILNSEDRQWLAMFKKGSIRGDLNGLLKITPDQWHQSAKPEVNYVSAWSFVNYLLSSPEGQKTLNRVLAGIMRGVRTQNTLSAAQIAGLQAGWQNDIATRIPLYDTYLAPAMALAGEKEWTAAEAILSEGVKTHPDNPDLKFYRGQLYLEQQQYSQAFDDLASLEDRTEMFPEIPLLLAKTCIGLQDGKKARVYVQKYLKKKKNDPAAKELLKQISRMPR